MEQPHREQPRPTICTCRMRYDTALGPGWDSCAARTSGPDDPVCRDCARAGHPERPEFDPIIKTVRSNR